MLFDIGNAALPRLLWQTTLDTQCESFLVQDELVYLNTGWGLRIYDITNASSPRQLGAVDFEFSSNTDCFT